MRTFTLTLMDAPALRAGGDPDQADGVIWPTSGRRWSGDIEALASLLATPVSAAGKFGCPFFLVGAFEGNQRRNAAFQSASVIALDVEKGPSTQEAHQRLRAWCHVLYTTWRHTDQDHRFRLVLPLARDVDATEYKLLWTLLARKLDGGVDRQTKDLARALFLPAIRPDGERALTKRWEAPLLEPDAVLGEALALVKPGAPPRQQRPQRRLVLPSDAARREARRRLNSDPDTRRKAAEYLHARLREGRACEISCPGCGRRSVWFWLVPGRMKSARCNHLNSCGWWGPLELLLDTWEDTLAG